MLCTHCIASVSSSEGACPSCGGKFFITEQLLHDAVVTQNPKLLADAVRYYPDAKNKLAQRLFEKTMQEKMDEYSTSAIEGVVTYETVFDVVEIAQSANRSHKDQFSRTFAIYAYAYHAWNNYSQFLYKNHADSVLLSHIEKVCRNNITVPLEEARLEQKMIQEIPLQNGIKQWLAGSMLTMLFLDALRAEIFEKVSSELLYASNFLFYEDFSLEQLTFACEAKKYRTQKTSNKDAVMAFIRRYDTQVIEERIEKIERAILEQMVIALRSGQMDTSELPMISSLVLKKTKQITKEYELVVLVALLKCKWKGLSGLTLGTSSLASR